MRNEKREDSQHASKRCYSDTHIALKPKQAEVLEMKLSRCELEHSTKGKGIYMSCSNREAQKAVCGLIAYAIESMEKIRIAEAGNEEARGEDSVLPTASTSRNIISLLMNS